MSFLNDYFKSYQEFFEQFSLSDSIDPEKRKEWINKTYNILFGYYTVLDLNRKIHHYISHDFEKDNGYRLKGIEFKYHPIDTKEWMDKENESILFDTLRVNRRKNIGGYGNVPKYYQHFNYFLKNNKGDVLQNRIHAKYLNTQVQLKLLAYNVQVVLAEEILFFIFFKYFNRPEAEIYKKMLFEEVITEKKNIRYNFHQLLKYAASIEALYKQKIGTSLNSYFNDRNNIHTKYDITNWGKEKEVLNRRVIDEVLSVQSPSENDSLWKLLYGFYGRLEKCFESDEGEILKLNSSFQIADIIARFDIDSIASIWNLPHSKCMWDIMIFPMYRSYRYKQIRQYLPTYGQEVSISSPVLFHSFVKPVYQISNGESVDESISTLFGFHLTKEVCKHISKPLIEDVFIGQTVQYSLIRQQNRTAIATVMARNMSHNVGSHVLSRLVDSGSMDIDIIISNQNFYYTGIKEKNKGDGRRDLLKKKLEELQKEFWSNRMRNDEKIEAAIDSFLSRQVKESYYNQLMGNMISYLKTRQDFLADVVIGVPQVQSSKWFMEEVMMGIDSNRLLLNRISGVDNFYYCFEFEELVCKCVENCGNCSEICDIPIAVANDIMGQHAFYILLENIIRNTAKHGNNNNQKYTFTIRVEESQTNSANYRITVFDNVCIEEEIYIKVLTTFEDKLGKKKYVFPKGVKIEYVKEEQFKYYKKRIAPDLNELVHLGWQKEGDDLIYDCFKISKINKLILDQNIWIRKPILNDESKLRQGAWGLIEMEVCAAYLRRIPIEDIETDEFELKFSPEDIQEKKKDVQEGNIRSPILRAVNPLSYKDQKKKRTNCLGYRFYLPKPKELLIIDETGEIWNELEKKALKESKIGHKKRDAIVLKYLKEFESKGILILTNNLDYKTRYYGRIWKKWHFETSLIYQHNLLLLVTSEEDLDNLFSAENRPYNLSKLPTRKIHINAVKAHFIRYCLKNRNLYEDKNKVRKDFTFVDFIDETALYLVEVWRAFIYEKLLKKKLKFRKNNKQSRFLMNPTSGKDFFAKLDHHGQGFPVLDEDYKNGSVEVYESKFKPLAKKLSSFRDLFNLEIFKYFNSQLSNVLVLDERVQERVYRSSYKIELSDYKPKYAEIWDLCNVFIPPPSEKMLKHNENEIYPYNHKGLYINLNSQLFEENYVSKIKEIITNRFGWDKNNNKQCQGLDFLVIHLGIVEKIMMACGKDKNSPKVMADFLEELIKVEGDTCRDVKIIITSGRAPSANSLPKDIAFLSYSIVSQYLIEQRFKYLLLEVLNSARPKT